MFELTIEQLTSGLKERLFSSVELIKTYQERIRKNDDKIKSFVNLSENCLEEAKKADEEIFKDANVFMRKKLIGIPLAVKDNFLTIGIKTTASSKVLEDYYPVYDATVVSRLKVSGSIILGKTNMDAWAHGSSTETSQFFTTHNPWNINRLPGGSSGGSAAAVVAGFIAGAIGSETAGSIRQPASWCGVTGLKPSYGVVSRYGVIAMASSTDSPGPITKSVKDAKIVFSTLIGRDPKDATSVDFSLKEEKLPQNLTIGIPKEYFFAELQEDVSRKVFEAIETLKNTGLRVKEISLLDPKYSVADYTILQRAEVSSNLARYDGIRYGNDRSFFGDEARRRMMLGTYVLSAGYYDSYYLKAQKVRTIICHDFEKTFSEVDLIIAPTSPCTALPVGSSKGSSMFGELQDILVEASSLAGLPGLNIPCGFDKNGLPIGMQIIGPRFSESLILSLGEHYQSLTDWHKKKPKVEDKK